MWVDDVDADPSWSEKVEERLLWRGRSTGMSMGSFNNWNTSQRIRLVEMANRRGGETKVLFPNGNKAGPVGFPTNVKTSALNAGWMDVAFVDRPIQCGEENANVTLRDPETGFSFCDHIGWKYEWRRVQTHYEAWRYKYILDVSDCGHYMRRSSADYTLIRLMGVPGVPVSSV